MKTRGERSRHGVFRNETRGERSCPNSAEARSDEREERERGEAVVREGEGDERDREEREGQDERIRRVERELRQDLGATSQGDIPLEGRRRTPLLVIQKEGQTRCQLPRRLRRALDPAPLLPDNGREIL